MVAKNSKGFGSNEKVSTLHDTVSVFDYPSKQKQGGEGGPIQGVEDLRNQFMEKLKEQRN